MENNKLETKQNYLRNAILNKGYNAQDFFNFLIEKKGEEGGDLNNWNFNELQSIVKEFQSIYNNNNIENNNIENLNENNDNNNIEKIENNNIENNNIEINENNENKINNINEIETIKEKNEINNNNNNNNNIIKYKENINNIIEIDCLSDDKNPLSKYNQLNIILSE